MLFAAAAATQSNNAPKGCGMLRRRARKGDLAKKNRHQSDGEN